MRVRGKLDGRVTERRFKAGWLAVWLAAAGSVAVSAEVRYAVIPLIEGAPMLVPEGMGLNEKGEVVGSTDLFGAATFWIWRNGQRETLEFGPGYRGVPTAIDNLGRVVGACESGLSLDHAILWEAGHLTDLGTLGGEMSSALWINDAGAIIGASDNALMNDRIPFLWQNGRMRPISSLATNAQGWTFALETHYVAADGRIWGAGTYRGTEGCIYEMTPQPDGDYSIRKRGQIQGIDPRVYAFNESGQAAGIAWIDEGGPIGPVLQGFLWDERGTVALGALNKHGSYAYALNSGGQVVGYCETAFLWENGVMFDLNDLIPPNGGYRLHSAEAINDAGMIVCKSGNLTTGRTGACLLVPLTQIKLELTDGDWTPEGVRFEVWGGAGLPLAIDSSSNATAWTQLTILTNLTAPRQFVDPDSRQIGSRFYRARLALP